MYNNYNIRFTDACDNVLASIEKAVKEFNESHEPKKDDLDDGQSSIVILDVGGTVFKTEIKTLRSVKGSYFDLMFSKSYKPKIMDGTTNTYFIDRDGTHFMYILNHLRGNKLVVPNDLINCVEEEMRFYSIKPTAPESIMITSNQQRIVLDWCNNKYSKMKLMYRATRDGFGASMFHQKCDNNGPTVSIIKSTDGSIFGGKTDTNWSSPSAGTYGVDPNAFLFSLVNSRRNSEPVKYPCSSSTCSTYNNPPYGPTFGGGHDIHVSDNSNLNQGSYQNFPYSYSGTTVHGSTTFASTKNFTVAEIEVFQLV
ncbi:hypothetical protein SAMD00019534_005270, partial [Acytostelium subglobosum LB1]|uniref:hypothetical protein n=1 Tax=Acytostelium subglobosum LB1 TaxID=1410327 RepID=UPI000644E9DF